MTKKIAIVGFALVVTMAAAGCKKKKKDGETVTPTVDAAAATPTPTPTPTPDTTAGMNKMKNCPNAVDGATTTIAKTADAVELTIVGKDDAAAAEIRSRAKMLVEAAKAPAGDVKHTGVGTGGGGMGHCPVVMQDTTVAAADVDKGTKITLKPTDATKLDWLNTTVTERNTALPAAIKSGDGSGTGGGTGGGEGGGGGGGTGGGATKGG